MFELYLLSCEYVSVSYVIKKKTVLKEVLVSLAILVLLYISAVKQSPSYSRERTMHLELFLNHLSKPKKYVHCLKLRRLAI